MLLTDAPAGSRSYTLAANADQGALLLDALGGYVRRTSGLAGLVKVERHRVTVVESGASLQVLAADVASSWGLSPWLVIVDEVAQWAETPRPADVVGEHHLGRAEGRRQSARRC